MRKSNPFPGMNPWLESCWGTVRALLTVYASENLNAELPEDLAARLDERRFVDGSPAEVTESWVRIVDVTGGDRLLTAVEFVSRHVRMPGRGRDVYLTNRQEALASGANIVEIELLRGGEPVALACSPRHNVPEGRRGTYHVSVLRAEHPGRIEYWPLPLRQRLPLIPVPLRHADVRLDLQALIDQAYVRGRHYMIDYSKPPMPPLDVEDAAWAAELVKESRSNPP